MKPIVLFLLFLVACREPVDRPPVIVEDPAAKGLKPQRTQEIKVPEFVMQEARRGALRSSDLDGKVWIAATMFTHCPGICPPITQAMAGLQGEFKDQSDFRLVSITVDPARDTPEVLTQFAAGYGAKQDRWFFVRNQDRKALGKFVEKGLRLAWNAEEPLAHPPHIVLVDRDGTIRGYFDGTDPARVDALKKEMRAVFAEKSGDKQPKDPAR
jgi:protein SCO1/2